jgi:hypothetical protein
MFEMPMHTLKSMQEAYSFTSVYEDELDHG